MSKSAVAKVAVNGGQAIEVPESLASAILAIIQPDWALLPNYYPNVKYEVHLQGTKEPIIKALVSK